MAEVVKGIIDVEINTGNAASQLKVLQQQINSVFLSLNKNNATSAAASKSFATSIADSINASRVFTAEQVKMRTAAGALDDTLRKGQATFRQYFSAKYVKNGALFAETLDLSRKRAALLQTQFVATGAASRGMQDALAIKPLQAFVSQASIAAQRTQILSSMFKQGTTQLINFGKNVQWAGRQLMVGFTVPLTIFGTTAGRVFRELEMQVVSFKKVYGDLFTTPAELEQNLQAVQDLAKEYTKYGIAVKDTIGLAAQAAAAGRRNTDLTDAVAQATRLATLGQMDQNQALETTIALQSAFKLSGEELANSINFLNMVENQTVVSLQDLAAAIPRVAPVIQGLGGDVKDLSVFLAAMQEGGVSAEQGANALKSGLASLINPTKNAKETLAGFNINLEAIINANRGDLMKTVMGFGQALSTLDEFSRQQALEEVFGKFQYARLGALFENIVRDGSQASQVMSTMGYSVEELRQTAEKELGTIEQAVSVQLQGAIERFKLSIAPIGELFTRVAIPIVNFVTKIAEAFNNLPDFQKKFIAFATIITGLVIPAGTMFFGLLMNLTGTLARIIQFMGAFGKGFAQGGIVAAFKNASQSAKYFSNAEIEAALAAQQLGGAAEFTNSALREQITQAMGASGAIKYLSDSYNILIGKMLEAANLAPFTMKVGERAAGLAATGFSASGRVLRPPQRRNDGGRIFMSDGTMVPGTGNTDTVPAMLTPGEFVVNKEATQKNLGLLYAINGGGAGFNKGGILNANSGLYVDPATALAISQSELNAFTSKAKANRRSVQARASAGQVLGQLSNFVYLVDPLVNQQLVGNRTMKGFDKRGVPAQTLLNQFTSDTGMWMIDSYSGGKWAKSAYKETLKENFNSIINQYPGKEVRFVDPKGIGRVSGLIGTPGYENVVFVSTKDLHNEKLFSRLTPGHLERLMSLDSANVMQSRLKRGVMTDRSTYIDINSNSYTKRSKSWRGTKRPAGKHGAHVFNKGGRVPVQYLNGGGTTKSRAISALMRSRQVPTRADSQRINLIKKDPNIKNLINRFLDKEFEQIFEGMLLNDAIVLKQKKFSDETIIKHLSRYDRNDPSDYRERLSQFLIEKGRLRGSLSTRQAAATASFRAQVMDMLIEAGLISKTSRNLIKEDRGHHEPFTKHRAQSTVRQGYFGQAAFDDTNQLYRILQTKGIYIGETASTPGELAFQQKKLRESLGLEEFQFLNKGGMAGKKIQYFNRGGLGKAIFERARVGKPKVMNLSGLDSRSMNMIDELAPFIGADAAVDYAKILQKGYMKVDIGEFFKKAKGLEDIVQKRYSEWKSQNQWAVYSPGYQDVRDRALNKIRRQVTDQEFKRISTGKESLVDEYNRYIDDFMNRPRMNKGGMIPGVQYLSLGGIGKRLLNTPSRRSRQVLRSLFKDADSIAKSKGNKGIFDDVAKGKQNFLETSLASAKHAVGEAYAAQVMPVYQSLLERGIIKPGQFNSFDDFMNFLSKKSVSSTSTTSQKRDPLVAAFNEEFMRINHGLGPNDTLRFYRNSRPGRGSDPRVGYYSLDREMAWGYGLAGDINVGGGKRYHIDLKPGDIPGPIMSGGYADEFAINIGNELASQAKEIGSMLPNISKQLTGQQGMTRFFNDKKFYSDKDLATMKFNSGNIVPGMGNTDTVPAMLTPGEFVVNKEATRNNLNLLHAINNGSLAGYNNGGKIPGVQYFAKENQQRVVSPIKFSTDPRMLALYKGEVGPTSTVNKTPDRRMMNPMAQMGLMSAGFMLPMIGQQMQESSNKFSKGIGDFIGFLTPALLIMSILPTKLGAMVAGIALVGVAAYKVAEKMKEIQKSGNEFAKAMYGSAESTKKFSETFNRQTASQRLATRISESRSGTIDEQAKLAAQEFIKSDLGKQLVKDIQTISNAKGDATQALLNQLTRQIISGTITSEEARAIAAQVGEATGNLKLGFTVTANIKDIYDEKGKLITNNILELTSKVSPILDEQGLQSQVDRLYKAKTYSGLGKLIGLVDNDTIQKNKIAMGLIQQTAVETANIERESRAAVRLAFLEGRIAIEEYNLALDDINKKDATGQVFQRSVDLLIKQNKLTDDLINKTKRGAGTALNPFGSPRGDTPMLTMNKELKDMQKVQDFYNESVKSYITFTEDMGIPKSVRDENLDFAEKFGSNLIESSRILSDIMSGDLGTGTIESLKTLTDEQLFELKAQFQSGQMSQEEFLDLLNQLESYPEIQEKILKVAVEDGEEVTQTTKDVLDVLNTIDSLPADIRANIKLDTTDLNAVLGYKDEAEKIKSTYTDVSDYIKRTKDDISKKDIQQKVITKFAPEGTNASSLWNMITEGGKKELDPLKLPILLSLMYDPQIQRLMDIASGKAQGTTIQAAQKASEQLNSIFGGLTLPTVGGVGTGGGTGEESELTRFLKSIEQQKKYISAIQKISSTNKLDTQSLAGLNEELAIEIAKRKDLLEILKKYQDYQVNARRISQSLLSSEEKQMQVLDIQDKIYNRQLQLIDRRIDAKQRDIELIERENEARQKGLDELSKQEETINQQYDKRLEALDAVDRANERNASRERSRIDIAQALSSGDVAQAARAAAELQQRESEYKIEDARSKLELTRQKQIDALTTMINGKLLTRKEIENSIASANEKIAGISLQIRDIEDEKLDIYKLQNQLIDERYKLEIANIAKLTQNLEVFKVAMKEAASLGITIDRAQSDVTDIIKPTTPITPSSPSGQTPKPTPNLTPGPTPKPSTNTYAYAYTKPFYAPTPKPAVYSYYSGSGIYGSKSGTTYSGSGIYGSTKKYFGGMINYKGSREPAPSLKMAYGSIVPGLGNSDRVPALLTPGEFVIRKSVASAYMPLLETLNNQTYPMSMPKGAANNSSNMYNTYSVNVNVAGTDASPDEIANAVMSKIKSIESRSLRGVKVVK